MFHAQYVEPALGRVKAYSAQAGISLLSGEVACFEQLPADTAELPQFKGQSYLDFPADQLFRTDKKILTLVDDLGALNRIAVRMNVEGNRKLFQLPQKMGGYDVKEAKTLNSISIDQLPPSGQYRWYRLPGISLNRDCYLYVTNSWQIQLPLRPR